MLTAGVFRYIRLVHIKHVAPKGLSKKRRLPLLSGAALLKIQVRNKKLIHLHLNWVEVSNLTSAQLEQKLIRTCSQLGHKLYVGRKLANRAKLQHFAHFRIFSFASICKMTCEGNLPGTHRHQMKLVQKVRKQLGKQGEAVPLSSFF
jgi:hypothetical protein